MILVYVHVTIDLYSNLNIIILMADEDLKLETKCYDANEYGYLYGLNRRIPDEEFEKVNTLESSEEWILKKAISRSPEDLKDGDALKRMSARLKRFLE